VMLRRVENLPGRFIVGREQMCYWPDGGDLSAPCIRLNHPRKASEFSTGITGAWCDAPKKAPGGSAASAAAALAGFNELGGLPGEMVYLPDQNKMVLKRLCPAARVGVVDLKSNRLEQVVTPGRSGVKFAKVAGSVAASVALTATLTAAAGQFLTVLIFPSGGTHYDLRVRTDGQYIYALNSFTNDVTIIETLTGTVVDKIAVGGGCRGIGFTPDQAFLVAWTPGQITFIDAKANKKRREHQLQNESVNNLYLLKTQPRIVALTTTSLLVFDANSGSMITSVKGYFDPHVLAEASVVAPQ